MSNGATQPSLKFESDLRDRGFSLIAGLDEVGRGTLAGPVVAAAVMLPTELRPDATRLIRDSKQLSAQARLEAFACITELALDSGIGACDSAEIDSMGIANATRLAMARALEELDAPPDHLLIDALELPALSIPQRSIIKGDSISYSIAAASIVAKVTRDRLMAEVFEASFPGYGFAVHKGYGTREHLAALTELGPCPIHRRSFRPISDILRGTAGQYGHSGSG